LDNNTGDLLINTATPLATLGVVGTSGTIAVASFSGQTSFATLVANNDGVGICSRLSQRLDRFTIQNNGNIAGNRRPDRITG